MILILVKLLKRTEFCPVETGNQPLRICLIQRKFVVVLSILITL